MSISTTNCLKISFTDINFDSPIEEAHKIRDLAVNFLKEKSDGTVNFDFGGCARLSEKFADELFRDKSLLPYRNKITTYGIHVFDQQLLVGAMEKASV